MHNTLIWYIQYEYVVTKEFVKENSYYVIHIEKNTCNFNPLLPCVHNSVRMATISILK